MKKALILGIEGALGSEIAKDFISQGYCLIGTYYLKRPEDYTTNDQIKLFQVSFENPASISKFLEEISSVKFDVVINTIANPLTFNKFEKIPFEYFEKDISVNVLGFIRILQGLISNLNNYANIISILTEMTIGEPPNYFSSYIVSKYALLGLTKSLANELKSKNIRVNAVSPGMMNTKFITNLPELVKQKYLYNFKEFTSPKKVVDAIRGIISGSINGENILVK
jgi:3-oxoacyl-[acyl-carrier protein] reductase